MDQGLKDAIEQQVPVAAVFGHKGKSAAIQSGHTNRHEMLAGFVASQYKLSYLESLPYIGSITKYPLGQGLGAGRRQTR